MLTRTIILTVAASVILGLTGMAAPHLHPWTGGYAFAGDDDDDDDDDRGRRQRFRMPAYERFRAAPPRAERRSRQRAEIVATGLSADDLNRLASQGFAVVAQQQSGLLGTALARLQIPPRQTLSQALWLAAAIAPNAAFASNDLYRRPAPAFYRPRGQRCGERCEAFELTAWTEAIGQCSAGTAIGIVDTGVDTSHPSLFGARITTRTIRSPDRSASDMDHGTAIVSLLVGRPGTSVTGIVPQAQVFAADAFHGAGRNSNADVYDLVAALDWLSTEKVRVINLSLSGPDNAILKRAIDNVVAAGATVVAASGVPDRSGTSGYPARYDGVIAVAAVDNRLRASRLSARGEHIAFAAPGVGVAVADRRSGMQLANGSSFATPFVTAAYAVGLKGDATGPDITTLLSRSAKDLGAPGRDAFHGWGLVQYDAIPRC